MRQENKESLIKFAKVIALFVVGMLGIVVSANAMNTGGFYVFAGILNFGTVAYASWNLYKYFFKKEKPKEDEKK